MYTKNTEPGPGRLALGGDFLLLRPHKFDAETEADYLAQLIDKNSLEVWMQDPCEVLRLRQNMELLS